ncbi:amidohydrolase family protein [Nocardia sp. NPDC005978]|uniref:amidohydrolase family protein n=1 Tax=Nocardia sp. NPDC005978 TaxID=3156725 RepID=UPI0033AE3087
MSAAQVPRRTVFRDVEVAGEHTDVLVRDGRVVAVGRTRRGDGGEVIDGAGGALLPGLHDHHLHLLAMAAASRSVECGPGAVRGLRELRAALRQHDGQGWVRGVGYHESVAGTLDRHVVDRLCADRPVRIQHRSGALWMLNSLALQRISSVLDDSADVERDAAGEPTGRLWRYDGRLRAALPDDPPELRPLGRALVRAGITGVTDATPDLDTTAVAILAAARADGALPQRLTLLGADLGAGTGFTVGPRKLLLRDHDLPDYDRLAATVAAAHLSGRPVAVHCVTRVSLLLTLAVLAEVGTRPGDRIEHAAVVPADVAQRISDLGLRVVTQPGFLRARGDDYLREVDPDDLAHLYPHAGLLCAGVPVALSSDAPHGPLDPWANMRAAVDRSTCTGHVLGVTERVDARTALAGYLCAPDDPGGPARTVTPGARADLCLLEEPLAIALDKLDSALVRGVMIEGRWHDARR